MKVNFSGRIYKFRYDKKKENIFVIVPQQKKLIIWGLNDFTPMSVEELKKNGLGKYIDHENVYKFNVKTLKQYLKVGIYE